MSKQAKEQTAKGSVQLVAEVMVLYFRLICKDLLAFLQSFIDVDAT